MKTRVQRIVSVIKKPFTRKPKVAPASEPKSTAPPAALDVSSAIVFAVREQRAFEIAHPIKFAHDQRERSVLQRIKAKGTEITPEVEQMTSQIVGTIAEWES